MSSWLRCACVWALAVGCASTAVADPARQVLLIYSSGRLLPANVDFERGIRTTLQGLGEGRVDLFEEFLDAPRFDSEDHFASFARYLVTKYAAQTPDVVVAAGFEALRFVVRHRAGLLPGVPVVHAVVATHELRTLGALPPDVVGVPVEDDFRRTVDQALRWRPRATHLVIVTGTSERDRRWEARVRSEARDVEGRATVEFLAGLPTPAVLERLAQLGEEAVVFTPGYFADGAGRSIWPRDSVAAMVAVSGAPVFGTASTFLGTGIVGGYMVSIEGQGRHAGATASRLLEGASAGALAVPELLSPILHVDWRQVERWRIDQGAVPQDAVVLYRSPSFLESHQREALTAAAVFVAQASLIGVLLMERRRRQRAESSAAASRHELAHASRLAVAGELTAAVAHEINQPLGAILTNAETAELVLESGEDRRDLLRRILADIRRDDLRAGQVIQRLRTLLQKQEVSRQPFDLDVAVADAEAILRPEARRRAATLTVVPSGTTIAVTGDRIQIQQVLINLVLNALDAVAQVPEDRRRVSIAVHRTGAGGLIEVTDGGPGIPADQIEHVFESFFSTKRSGMGLGLSIARTLIEAHGGRIWAGNGTEGGAVFRVELPADGQSMPSARG